MKRPFILLISAITLASCGKTETTSTDTLKTVFKMGTCYEADDTSVNPELDSESDVYALIQGDAGSYKGTSTGAGAYSFDISAPIGTVVSCWTGIGGAHASWNGSELEYTIDIRQDGKADAHFMSGQFFSGQTGTCKMTDQCCVVYIKVPSGNYSIKGASFKSVGGEKIAGKVTYNISTRKYTASEDEISIILPESVNCKSKSYMIAVQVAPALLSKGYEVSVETEEGYELLCSGQSVNLIAGGREYTPSAKAYFDPENLYCGSNKVIMYKTGLITDNKMNGSALTWSWDAQSVAGTVGRTMDHIDDAKVVSYGKELIVTSSYNWCVLLDIATKDLLFWASQTGSPHSADLLPEGCIVVAASEGYVRLYKRDKSDTPLANYSLSSAHSAVWMEKKQRLYCSGGTSLNIYKLNDAASDSPSLSLEKTISTSGFVTSNHDMSKVDDNTLVLGGNGAALFDITTEQFTKINNFTGCKGIKSINVNPETREVWCTYAWSGMSEGGYDWSSYKMRYYKDYNSCNWSNMTRYITVEDTDYQVNIYKVRVIHW